MAEWTIEQNVGRWDLFRDRRVETYDCDDIDEAVSIARRSRRWEEGDSIVVIDSTGYRRTLRG